MMPISVCLSANQPNVVGVSFLDMPICVQKNTKLKDLGTITHNKTPTPRECSMYDMTSRCTTMKIQLFLVLLLCSLARLSLGFAPPGPWRRPLHLKPYKTPTTRALLRDLTMMMMMDPISTTTEAAEAAATVAAHGDTPLLLLATSLASVLSLPPPTVWTAAKLGIAPAVAMNAVTLVGLRFATPAPVVGALQHFSAGILLTTVAKELLPEMVQASGVAENLASGVGFFAGVGLLIWLGKVFPEEEDEEEEEEQQPQPQQEEETQVLPPPRTRVTEPSLRNRKLSLRTRAYQKKGIRMTMPESSTTLAADTTTTTLPTALLAAVAIDSLLDGLLIGISTAVDPNTGPLLSASLTVESSFLGLTLAAALRNKSSAAASSFPWLVLAATTLAPAAIFSGSLLGGALAPVLAQNTVWLTGCLGFGTSTALFMVAEELLLQAHEDGSEHVWWVDFQLYTGFFASVMIEKNFGM